MCWKGDGELAREQDIVVEAVDVLSDKDDPIDVGSFDRSLSHAQVFSISMRRRRRAASARRERAAAMRPGLAETAVETVAIRGSGGESAPFRSTIGILYRGEANAGPTAHWRKPPSAAASLASLSNR